MKRTMLVILLSIAATGCHPKTDSELKPIVDVRVIRAAESDVSVVVQAPATVFAKEQANLAARLTAPIRELLVRKGESVGAQQLLARLENRDLLAQRLEAAAALRDAEASLAKVTSGTLPTQIEQARGQVATTQAALHQAQKFYERRKQLFAEGAIPARDLLVSETELAQATTNHDVAQKALRLLEGQSRERDIQIAQSRVEQARGRLAFIDAQLSYAEIRSPFAGTVTEQFLFPGDMAKPDTAIFTVADVSVAVARAQVPEANAKDVARGQPCFLYPSDQPDTGYPGTVTVVNKAVDTARRTVEVWCEIPNSKSQLRVGTFGNVTIVTGSLKKAIALPVSAIQFEEGSSKGTVMVADKDRRAVRRAVETAPTGRGSVAILQGLRAGEMVIVEGGYGLPEGTQVRWEAN